jgi:homopolymeric O-antigen transport system ATP-binding protein
VGPNGSGKSTALKLISRIIEPTRGQVTVKGKVSALIELGAGFHPDLTGRENVFLLGSIMGLSNKEMARRFNRIVGFAELEQFIDTPVKHYSSGMYMRLAFAAAINVDAEVLLIDEVLAVGDQGFQEKCHRAIAEFQKAGMTMIVVSHDLGLIQRFCQRAVYLQGGVIAACGETPSVLKAYVA